MSAIQFLRRDIARTRFITTVQPKPTLSNKRPWPTGPYRRQINNQIGQLLLRLVRQRSRQRQQIVGLGKLERPDQSHLIRPSINAAGLYNRDTDQPNVYRHHLQVAVNGKTVLALIDSGNSWRSAISEDFFFSLGFTATDITPSRQQSLTTAKEGANLVYISGGSGGSRPLQDGLNHPGAGLLQAHRRDHTHKVWDRGG
jgi:hypothetical protein